MPKKVDAIIVTWPKSPFQRPIIDERVQQRARGGMGGSDVTNDDAVLFHYLWYEFCRGRRGAGRRFSDSAPLEARIKLPSVS